MTLRRKSRRKRCHKTILTLSIILISVPYTFFWSTYLRGLAFAGDYAVLGVSGPRHERTFTGLALDEELSKRQAEARCGLQVIDLRSGDVVHWLRIEGMVQKLYDVVVLPGVVRPMALGLLSDEIRRTLSQDEPGPL